MKNQIFNYLTIGLLSVLLFVSCGKNEDKPSEDKAKAEITASFKFSNGETTDFAFTHKKDDIVQSYVYGPNGNDHYKLWLRGEKEIGNKIYTINIYVTMPEKGVGDYPFGWTQQYQDEGFVTETHVDVTDKDNPLMLKQYSSFDANNESSNGLTITSLTKGTFSGTVIYREEDKTTIVNGKFDTAINRGGWPD